VQSCPGRVLAGLMEAGYSIEAGYSGGAVLSRASPERAGGHQPRAKPWERVEQKSEALKGRCRGVARAARGKLTASMALALIADAPPPFRYMSGAFRNRTGSTG